MTDDGFWKYCVNCGATLGITDWPPVVEATTDGDETLIQSFCDDQCKRAWNDSA